MRFLNPFFLILFPVSLLADEDDKKAIEIAARFLDREGLSPKDWEATPSYVIEKGTKLDGANEINPFRTG